jgi:hypothetical protein
MSRRVGRVAIIIHRHGEHFSSGFVWHVLRQPKHQLHEELIPERVEIRLAIRDDVVIHSHHRFERAVEKVLSQDGTSYLNRASTAASPALRSSWSSRLV